MSDFQKYFASPEIDEEYLASIAVADDPSLDAEMSRVFDALCDKTAKRGRSGRPSILRYVAAACCALMLIAGGVVAGRLTRAPEPASDPSWTEVRVPNGETRKIQLADGTVVRLNSGSRITYPLEFNCPERHVFLDGEAVMEVARDPEHPFVVKAGDLDITVLGTTFDVKSYSGSDCSEVLLMEGTVRLSIGGLSPVMMSPGNVVHYERSTGRLTKDNFDVASFNNFDEGRSVHFFNLSLSDIALDLERLFGTEIVITDSRLLGERFFAIFNNNETLFDILRTLNTEGRMKIEKIDHTIYISHK